MTAHTTLIDPETNGTGIQRRTAEYQPPRSWRTWLIGRPLPTADAPHQTIGKLVGLAVFASDALSSTAYSTQEIKFNMAAAGAGAFSYAFPLSLVIVGLLAIVTLSYEQIIHAYPNGGGAYIVARDNLGDLPAQIAGAALLTDYILTVAVSISSGVAQVTSAFPALFPHRVEIAVGLVLALQGQQMIPSYFIVEKTLFPVWPVTDPGAALRLFFATMLIVLMPKFLGLALEIKRARHAREQLGATRALLGVITETLFSILLSPILMVTQTAAVFQVLFGIDSGWRAQSRNGARLQLMDAVP
jgi:amino acid transporter